tara:strand:+ start:1165 stop:1647 length:483 start_codon:yes stop_codon:yes gene_type:complete
MKKSNNGMNRADDSIMLSNVINDLLSGKATNLDAINLAIKGFAVKCAQQRGHQTEAKLNGKSSAKTNPYFARIARELPTHELEAKAKAKAEKAKAKAEKAKPVDNVKQQKLDELQSDLRDITAKLEELQGYDKRRSVTRDEIAKQTARLIAVKAQIKELS